MNPEQMKELLQKLSSLEEDVASIRSTCTRLDTDYQSFVRKNHPIIPGSGVKVTYDEKGLITGNDELIPADIPELPVSKIMGLDAHLVDMSRMLFNMHDTLKGLEDHASDSKVFATATKVNVDQYGHVRSVSNLLVSDIPNLPMSKIEGLEEMLDILRMQQNTPQPTSMPTTMPTPLPIEMNDLPGELLSKLNEMESQLANLPHIKSVNRLMHDMGKKVDALESSICPGTYTKVRVNENGLVTSGGSITKHDLPDIEITDIKDLDRILRSKVDRSDLNDIQSSLEIMMNTSGKISDVLRLGSQINQKANDEDVQSLRRELQRVSDQVSRISEIASIEMVQRELKSIQSTLSEFSGRLSNIENQMNIR